MSLLAPSARSEQPTALADLQADLIGKLKDRFDAYLRDPAAYSRRVAGECGGFPEGDLFPYLFPAFAYANLALSDPSAAEAGRKRMAQLIDLARVSVLRKVRPPKGRLDRLGSYKNHATYLGQYNLALGAFARIGGDDRYSAEHKRISDLFQRALVSAKGRPLNSFPTYSWPFDTVPVLVSLALYDRKTGIQRSANVIQAHLRWTRDKATNRDLGLPHSRVNPSGAPRELPRGCDLSLRLCLLPHLDQAYSKQVYQAYVRHHWLERGFAAGFAEWPGGRDRYSDMDSGPIFWGLGFGATGLGIGATLANGDRKRFERLLAQLGQRDALMGMLTMVGGGKSTSLGGMIPMDPGYLTGFLFGDAILFYVLSWQPW